MNAQRPASPKEGVYLDAALDAVGGRIEAHIDTLAARRRTRTRGAIATLALAALAGGAATASALALAPHDPPPPSYTSHTLECTQDATPGTTPGTPTVAVALSFRINTDHLPALRPAALCLRAVTELATDPRIRSASPAELLIFGERMLRDTSVLVGESGERLTVDTSVESAALGTAVAPDVRAVATTCVGEGATLVHLGERALDCAGLLP